MSKWVSHNRRYVGLSFAAGFGWQAVCISVLFALQPSYYGEELHKTSDLIARIASYIFLIAMTVTSFFPVRRKMRAEHWVGIWYFWAAIWVSYAGQAVSSEVRTIDVVYTVMGLFVLFLGIAAYLKTRAGQRIQKTGGLGT